MKLCPYLTFTSIGSLVVRGRARFAEGTIPPPATTEARFFAGSALSPPVPPAVIAWEGESFTARFSGLSLDLVGYVDDALGEAMHEGQRRADGAEPTGECVWRIDAITWEAHDEIGAEDYISGLPGKLVVRDGRPVAVEVRDFDECSQEMTELAFKAVFRGRYAIGPWETTRTHEVPGRPAAFGPVLDARAEVLDVGADEEVGR